MKKLLLSLTLMFSSLGFFAQGTSCTATEITANGTVTLASFSTSTFQSVCLPSKTGIKASWYKYTATANGEVTISSNLPANNGTTYTDETRVSVLKGASCSALSTCIISNDDISETNYLSAVTFPVASGTTYYIQWDNYWNVGAASADLGFKFDFTFSPVSCIRLNTGDFYRPDTYTTTSANLYWNQAIGLPTNYDIDWSTDFATAAGSGTIVTAPAGALTYAIGSISGIAPSSNFRYYVRSNCGGSQSAWQGPNYGYLAKSLPYSTNFENVANNYTDGFIGFSRFNASATSAPANYADGGAGVAMYTFNSTTAASNLWGYSRAVSLQAGEAVTVKFKTRLYGTAPMKIALKVGSAQAASMQTTAIQEFTTTNAAAYTQNTATWTAPADGIYYFGFNNNSAVGATQAYLFLDTIELTSVLSTSEFLANKFSVYPNPANDLVNIANTDNMFVNKVVITDLNGRIVKNVLFDNAANIQINVSDLSQGLYIMSITSDKGTAIKKMVKN